MAVVRVANRVKQGGHNVPSDDIRRHYRRRTKLGIGQLPPLLCITDLAEAAEDVLKNELSVDLFDPPQRVVFRERGVQLRRAGQTERSVAQVLNIAVTAAQKVTALDRLMQQRGLTDPYLRVSENN